MNSLKPESSPIKAELQNLREYYPAAFDRSHHLNSISKTSPGLSSVYQNISPSISSPGAPSTDPEESVFDFTPRTDHSDLVMNSSQCRNIDLIPVFKAYNHASNYTACADEDNVLYLLNQLCSSINGCVHAPWIIIVTRSDKPNGYINGEVNDVEYPSEEDDTFLVSDLEGSSSPVPSREGKFNFFLIIL